ncbi:MAG: phosphatidylserine decarboxylase [Planctomycetaceae bacterium]|jgi:phosphatidylserine decarboxylase
MNHRSPRAPHRLLAQTGDEFARGEQLGMIKLGSCTELLLPREEGLEIVTKFGDKIVAGETIMARFPAS